MIKLSHPILRFEKDEVYMECDFIHNDEKKLLWYSTTKEYAKYLSFERADAFLLGVFQFAMSIGEEITVEAPVSEKLYYNLTSLVIPSIAEAYHQKKIQIHCDCLDCSILKADGVNERERAVGTGCSLGVDSFSTILKYLSDSIPPNYRVTHLTYFNVGAHGNNTEKATESWEKDYPLIKGYADFKKLPLVTVSSNIGILYEGWNYDACHHSRNLGAVMALQKLFSHYVYASGFPILDLSLDSETTAYFETVIGPGLSTENTEVSIGLADYTRTDKTRLICEYP